MELPFFTRSSTSKPNNAKSILLVFFVLVYWSSLGLLANSSQDAFSSILLYSAVAYTLYLAFLRFRLSIVGIFIVGFIVRCYLVTVFPSLSDDIYRFIWDGKLTTMGLNPYGHLPSDLVENHPDMSQLYSELNSPHYFTIYPSVSQVLFAISTMCSSSLWGSSLLLKIFFLLAEMATFLGIQRLLNYLNKPLYLMAIYWLNPLIIVEGVGNLHLEIIMISFLTWSLYYLFVKQRLFPAAVYYSLAIATKLLPLMFLPFLLFKMQREKWKYFLTVGAIATFILFTPIILGVQLSNFASSIDLYFQKFEFNASLYYLLRYIGKLITGYNLIAYVGPMLGVFTLFAILRRSYNSDSYSLMNFVNTSLFAFTVYLFLATTVHPWYLSLPIFLSTFVSLRYVVVWSGMIWLTYINYSYEPYYENLWIVTLEYITVAGFLFYELIKKKMPTTIFKL